MLSLPDFDLNGLANVIKEDLRILDYPKGNWVKPRTTCSGSQVFDCVIIGGGQGGLGVAFGLMREKVFNILVIDENEEGLEGPWNTFARMPTLRTPKYLTGLDFGNPHLTFEAYYTAKHGQVAYQQLSLIPTSEWADYLSWYRHTLAIPVQNQTRAQHIHYDEHNQCFAITYVRPNDESIIFARTIVLANGIDGSGQWQCPDNIRYNLNADRYAHTRQTIDFMSLKGKRVCVLGAGASAFDNAVMALEASAKTVELFSRRSPLPTVNPYRWAEFVGFLKHHGDLSDEERWRFIHRIVTMGQLPPKATIERALTYHNFRMRIGESCNDAAMVKDGVEITTKSGTHTFDFVIVGTGFVTNLALRPELVSFYEHIACWKDRFSPPAHLVNDDLLNHPYLGANFEFQEKSVGKAPYLSSIFSYNFGCLPSLGFGGSSISGLKYSLPKVVAGITRKLFREDARTHLHELQCYAVAEYDAVVLEHQKEGSP